MSLYKSTTGGGGHGALPGPHIFSDRGCVSCEMTPWLAGVLLVARGARNAYLPRHLRTQNAVPEVHVPLKVIT